MNADCVILIALAVSIGLNIAVLAVVMMRRRKSRPERSVRRDSFDRLPRGVAVLAWGVLVVLSIVVLKEGAFLLWMLLLILSLALMPFVRKYQATQQYALLWVLTVAAERNMPLAPAVEAFGWERGGLFGWRIRRLARALGEGVPLAYALEKTPGVVPLHVLPLVRVGSQSGALATSLRHAATDYHLAGPVWQASIGKLTYLFVLPPLALLILTFVMLKIVPSFEKIFKDFGTALPPMTVVLMRVSYFMINYWFLFVPLCILPFLYAHAVVRYFGWTRWDLPGMSRLTRRIDSALILDGLAMVAGQQRPLIDGVDVLADSHPKGYIRRRLRRAAADIRSGRNWCESLCSAGLIGRAETAILQAAQRVGNLSWALSEMADSNRRRLAYRVQAAVQVLFPFVILGMGLIVMFIVVALFAPLVSLIARLA